MTIYNSISSWKDKTTFAYANSFFCSIAFNTNTDIVYNIYEEDLVRTLPAATATTICLHLDVQLKEAFMDRVLVTFTKTIKLLLSVHVELSIHVIEKLFKTGAKKGVGVMVVSSDQKEIIEDVMKLYEEKYKIQHRETPGGFVKIVASERKASFCKKCF